MDTGNPFFFRVNEFILVPPPSANEIVLGLVLALRRYGPNHERIGNMSIAVEGCTDAISIMPRLCEFSVTNTKVDEFLCAETRANVSTAMRFSELPASSEAQHFLTNAVRRFLPAYPEASILPLRVFRPSVADRKWIRDRTEGFFNYSKDKKEARQRMGKLFNVACAALSAATHIGDDRSTHSLTAVVKNLRAHPVCLHLEVYRLSSETGWKSQRPADVWIVDSNIVAQMVVHKAKFDYKTRITYVELRSTVSCHLSLARAVERFCRRRSETEHEVDICVRLGNLPSGADPVFTLLAEHKIFAELDKDDQPRRAHQILDAVYDHRAHLYCIISFIPGNLDF
ncbi:unnamed protein product [Heligmosomoides polygyrus]|uniref:DUF1308 domain-containing protein n=1 Tax=Heligmosomoides polygyrus TaxID=6339 RepID=A0A183F585_HELPZ|nr:unnamed protein product [Heligmosomoides polygyrus]